MSAPVSSWPSRRPRELAEEEVCQSLRSDGRPCQARRWGGTACCWAHQAGRFPRGPAEVGEEEGDPLGAVVEAWLLAWEAAHGGGGS
jgi:hypothetical protein